ncbi:MAG: K(+)-transporting ATPase subunit C, partial [Pseudonocardia sp.]|nr:K(+)-transporting ATPase subunit C [Pseudonocardia sp.]
MLTLLTRQTAAALRVLLALTVLLGVAYPLTVWAVSRLPGLHANAEGSILTVDGQPVGSSLIGIAQVPADPAADPYFHPRPSATAEDELGIGPADPSVSGGSNKGGFSEDLLAAVQQRRAVIAAREGVPPAAVPPDAVTASGSGLDPHISPAYAAIQIPRVARVTGLPEAEVRDLVAEHTDGRFLGFLGEPGVNVPELNLA